MIRLRWPRLNRQEKLTLLVFVSLALFIFAVLDTSYRSRVDLSQAITASQRKGCLRGLADRHDNAEAWYAAYLARHHDALSDKPRSVLATSDKQSAAIYLTAAQQLNSRTYGPYSVTFPPGAKARPLGRGTLSCVKVFPEPRISFWAGIF